MKAITNKGKVDPSAGARVIDLDEEAMSKSDDQSGLRHILRLNHNRPFLSLAVRSISHLSF